MAQRNHNRRNSRKKKSNHYSHKKQHSARFGEWPDKRALCAFGCQQGAHRRHGFPACKVIFGGKPIRGAYERPGDYRMRGGFFCFLWPLMVLEKVVFIEQKKTKVTKISQTSRA
jgi:hypothetical protein